MKKVFAEPASKDDIDPIETNEWIDSLNSVIETDGSSRASYLLNKVIDQAYKSGLVLPDTRTTPYINTIPPEAETKSPGDQNIEKKINAIQVLKILRESISVGQEISRLEVWHFDLAFRNFTFLESEKLISKSIFFLSFEIISCYSKYI